MKQLTFTASDGTALCGYLHTPSGSARQAILIAGGLGVPQRYYRAFANWLAARDCLVMTFDLRGMGESRLPAYKKSLRGLNADMLTWARQDFAAAVSYLSALHRDQPIGLIGHSLGLHHAAMTGAGTQAKIERVISVAAGSGHWRDWAAPSRRVAPLMLHLAGPLLTPLFGYFPGKRLGMVGDLPAPAARQWMRWCRHPEFAWGCQPELVLPCLASARFPIQAFSFSDDDAMTLECSQKLLAALPNAPSQLYRIAPCDVGMQRIGHVGAFRQEAAHKLWPRLVSSILVK